MDILSINGNSINKILNDIIYKNASYQDITSNELVYDIKSKIFFREEYGYEKISISDKIKLFKEYFDKFNNENKINNIIAKFIITYVVGCFIKDFENKNEISKDEKLELYFYIRNILINNLEEILELYNNNDLIQLDDIYSYNFKEFIYNLLYSPLNLSLNILENITLFGEEIFEVENFYYNTNNYCNKLNNKILNEINIACKFKGKYYNAENINVKIYDFEKAYGYYIPENNVVIINLDYLIDCFLYNIYNENVFNSNIVKKFSSYNYDISSNNPAFIPLIIFNHEVYHGIFFNIIHKIINETDNTEKYSSIKDSYYVFLSNYKKGKYPKLNIIYNNLLKILLNSNNLTINNLIYSTFHYNEDIENISEILSMIISNGLLIKYVFENNYIYEFIELIIYFKNEYLKINNNNYNYDFNYLKIYNELLLYGKFFYDELININNIIIDSKSNNLCLDTINENNTISTKLNIDSNIVNDYEYCINELNKNISKTNNDYLDKLCIKLYLFNNNINYLELSNEFNENEIISLFENKLKLKLNKNTKNEIDIEVTIGLFYNNYIYYSPYILNNNILNILEYNYDIYKIYKEFNHFVFDNIKKTLNNIFKIGISDNTINKIVELYIKNNKDLFELFKYKFTDFRKTINFIDFTIENESDENIYNLYDKYIDDFIKNNNIPDINYNSYIFNNVVPDKLFLNDGKVIVNKYELNLDKFFDKLLKNNENIFFNTIKYKYTNDELYDIINNYFSNNITTNTSEEEQINILNNSKRYIEDIQSIYINYLFRLDNKTKETLDKVYSDFIKNNINGDNDYIPILFHHSKIFKNKKLKLNEAQISAIKNYSVNNNISLIHEVGLGKTLSSICCLSHSLIFSQTKNIFIVTPVKVFNKWRKELIGDKTKYGLLTGIKNLNVYSISNISSFNKKNKSLNEDEKLNIKFFKYKKDFFNEFLSIYYINIKRDKDDNITNIYVDINKLDLVKFKNILIKYKNNIININNEKSISDINIIDEILNELNNNKIDYSLIYKLLTNEIDLFNEFDKNNIYINYCNVTNDLISTLFNFEGIKITELNDNISKKYSSYYFDITFEIFIYSVKSTIPNVKINTYTDFVNYCKKNRIYEYNIKSQNLDYFDNLLDIIFLNYLIGKYKNLEKYYYNIYGRYNFNENNGINIFLLKESLVSNMRFLQSTTSGLKYNYSSSYHNDFSRYIINNNFNSIDNNEDYLLMEKFNIDEIIIDEAHNYNKNFEKVYNIFDKYEETNKIRLRNINALSKLSLNHSNKSIGIFLLINSILNKKIYSNKNNHKNIILLTATPYKNNPIEVTNFLLNSNRNIFYNAGIYTTINFIRTFFNLSYKQVFKANNKFGVTYAIESIKNNDLFKQIQNNSLHIFNGDNIIKRPEKIINPIDIYSKSDVMLNYVNEKGDLIKETLNISNFNLSTKIKTTSFQSIVFNSINSLTETYFDLYNQEISRNFNTILKNSIELGNLIHDDSVHNQIVEIINNNYKTIFNTSKFDILLNISKSFENYLLTYLANEVYPYLLLKNKSITFEELIIFLSNLKNFTYGNFELNKDDEYIMKSIKSSYQLSLFVLTNIFGRIIGICPFATHLFFDYFFSYNIENTNIIDYNDVKNSKFLQFKELITIEAENNFYFNNLLNDNKLEQIFNDVYDINNNVILNKILIDEKEKERLNNLLDNIKIKNKNKINKQIIDKEIRDILLDIIINSSSKLKFVIDYLDFIFYNNINKNVVIYSSLGNNVSDKHIKFSISEILIDYIYNRYNFTTFSHTFQIEDDTKKTNLREAEILTGSTPYLKREAIISAYEQNKIKVLYTSVKEAVDLQKNTIALINISIDWNYTDNEQIEGRVWRFGNENLFVNIIYPLLLNSADIAIFEKNIEKKHRLKSLLSNNNEINIENKNDDDDDIEISLSDNSIVDMVTDIKLIAKNIIYNEVIFNIENLKKINYDKEELLKLESKLDKLNFNDFEVILRYYLYKLEYNINIHDIKNDVYELNILDDDLSNKIETYNELIKKTNNEIIDYIYKEITYLDSKFKTDLINKKEYNINEISKHVILKIKKIYYQNIVNGLIKIKDVNPDINNTYNNSLEILNNIKYDTFIDNYEDEFNDIEDYIYSLSNDEIEKIDENNDKVSKISNIILNEYKNDYYDLNEEKIKYSIEELLNVLIKKYDNKKYDKEEINNHINNAKIFLNISNDLDKTDYKNIKFTKIFSIDNADYNNYKDKLITIDNKIIEFVIKINSLYDTLHSTKNDYNKNKKELEAKTKYINEENFIDYETINNDDLKNVCKNIEDKEININNYKNLINKETIFFEKNSIGSGYIINNQLTIKNKYGKNLNNTYIQIPTFIGTFKDIILKLQNLNHEIYLLKIDSIINDINTINDDEFILKYLCAIYNSDINKIVEYINENKEDIKKSNLYIKFVTEIVEIIKKGKKYNYSIDIIRNNIEEINKRIDELYNNNEYLKQVDRNTIKNIKSDDISKYINIIISAGGENLILKFLEKANNEINKKNKNVINSFYEELEHSKYKDILIKYKDYKLYFEDEIYDDEYVEVYDIEENVSDKLVYDIEESVSDKLVKDVKESVSDKLEYEYELTYSELYKIVNKNYIIKVFF